MCSTSDTSPAALFFSQEPAVDNTPASGSSCGSASGSRILRLQLGQATSPPNCSAEIVNDLPQRKQAIFMERHGVLEDAAFHQRYRRPLEQPRQLCGPTHGAVVAFGRNVGLAPDGNSVYHSLISCCI